MARSQTLLEAQFTHFSTYPHYGTAQEGVQLFDMDTRTYITPESIGLAGELDSINDFMASRGATPAHLKYTTIGLFSPDSPHADIPGSTTKSGGFVGRDLHIYGDAGLRFPVIALEHDSSKPNIGHLNFKLRHEIGHLLDADSEAPYNNERLIARMRAASAAAGALITPSAVDMFNPSTILNALEAGVSRSDYLSVLEVTSLSALAAIAMAYGLTLKPKEVMRVFSPGEYKANYFSVRNSNFQPFLQA